MKYVYSGGSRIVEGAGLTLVLLGAAHGGTAGPEVVCNGGAIGVCCTFIVGSIPLL